MTPATASPIFGTHRTALHTAADCSSTAAITMLLTKGATVNVQSSQIVTLLLDNDADIEACDSNGETPLHYACRNNRAAVVDALVVAGAKVGAANLRGDTPLHVTALHTSDSNTEAIKALVVAGARLGSRNNEGKTAYDMASAAQRDVDVLNLLRPAAASSSVAHVKIASNTDSEVKVDHVVAVDTTSATVAPTVNTIKQPATASLVDSCAAAAGTGTATACNIMSKREAARQYRAGSSC
jgi:Ankyrin repeats (3 copies)